MAVVQVVTQVRGQCLMAAELLLWAVASKLQGICALSKILSKILERTANHTWHGENVSSWYYTFPPAKDGSLSQTTYGKLMWCQWYNTTTSTFERHQ